jgi:hypothetical protein
MNRTQIVATRIVALVLALGAIASTSAHAMPHIFGVHRHPAGTQAADARVTIHLTNNGPLFKDVKVDGHVYTILPHQAITIKAPAGTPVYTESTGSLRHKGDLLFAVSPEMQGKTVSID